MLGASDTVSRLLVGLSVLLALIVVAGLGLWYYRRWMSTDPGVNAEPWTLADLRRLRDAGDLSEEEYERLRSAMIGGVAGAAPKDAAKRPDEPPITPENP